MTINGLFEIYGKKLLRMNRRGKYFFGRILDAITLNYKALTVHTIEHD